MDARRMTAIERTDELTEYLIDKICATYGLTRRELGIVKCTIHKRHPRANKARREAIAAAIAARIDKEINS